VLTLQRAFLLAGTHWITAFGHFGDGPCLAMTSSETKKSSD
jgi:hypothetical protein